MKIKYADLEFQLLFLYFIEDENCNSFLNALKY